MEILRDTLQTGPLFPTVSNLSVKLMLKDSSIGITDASGVIQQFNILQFQSNFDCDQAESCQALPCLAMRGAEGSEKFWESCCLPHRTLDHWLLCRVSLSVLLQERSEFMILYGRGPGQSFDQCRTYQDQAPNPT